MRPTGADNTKIYQHSSFINTKITIRFCIPHQPPTGKIIFDVLYHPPLSRDEEFNSWCQSLISATVTFVKHAAVWQWTLVSYAGHLHSIGMRLDEQMMYSIAPNFCSTIFLWILWLTLRSWKFYSWNWRSQGSLCSALAEKWVGQHWITKILNDRKIYMVLWPSQ